MRFGADSKKSNSTLKSHQPWDNMSKWIPWDKFVGWCWHAESCHLREEKNTRDYPPCVQKTFNNLPIATFRRVEISARVILSRCSLQKIQTFDKISPSLIMQIILQHTNYQNNAYLLVTTSRTKWLWFQRNIFLTKDCNLLLHKIFVQPYESNKLKIWQCPNYTK